MAGRVKNSAAPQDFTPALALADAVPVLFFAGAMLLLARRFANPLFFLGAGIITLAACGKVAWKLLLALAKKNVAWLNRYFIPCQIAGFLLAAAALVAALPGMDLPALAARVMRLPCAAFLLLWLAGMGVMGWYRKNRFDNSLRANWTAQIINTVTQGALLLGIWFA